MSWIRLLLPLMLCLAATVRAESFGFAKISDEVSFYKNTDDDFNSLGRTLQVIAINQVKIGFWFQVEFTGDFNWRLTAGTAHDYYIEVGVVKPVWKQLSLNYQRIYGTFVDKPVNQFGVRLRL